MIKFLCFMSACFQINIYFIIVPERRFVAEGERGESGRSDPLPGRGHSQGHHQPEQREPGHHGGEGETRSELAFNHSPCQGPETSFGASNFIPSWMFWQKLPRQLQYPKTVILHRRDGTSWGFSIVGAFLHQTTNTYYSPSCWGSVQKKCSMHFPICPQKNLRNADIYFIFQKESRYIALRNSFFLSITKGSW